MMRRPSPFVIAVIAPFIAAGCGGGGSGTTSVAAKNARDPKVQRAVQHSVVRETEKRIEQETGAFVDPGFTGPTRASCIPKTDTELSCIVKGNARAGFGDSADPSADGPFQYEWEVIVDPATGRFQAKPTFARNPGQ
jgi:hypothetical protein